MQSENPFQGIWLSDVGNVAIRSNGAKGKTIDQIVRSAGLSAIHVPSQFNEDELKGSFHSQGKVTAAKTIDWSVDIRSNHQFDSPNPLISIATDVHQILLGEGKNPYVLDKPIGLSRAQITENIIEMLSRGTRRFVARTSVASYARNPLAVVDEGIGLTMDAQTSFTVSPIPAAEIKLYTQGAGSIGYENAMPIIEAISREFDLDREEQRDLVRGMDLAELQSTNGGIRWLHYIFQRHIENVNGINRNEKGFNEELHRLWQILLGIPLPEMSAVMMNIVAKNPWFIDGDAARSLYRNINSPTGEENPFKGIWKKLLKLKGGWPVVLEHLSVRDINEMVRIAYLNFDHAHDRDQEHTTAYKQANTPDLYQKVFGSSPYTNGELFFLGARTQNHELAGFVLAGIDKEVLKIKRLHTALPYHGKGVASALVQQAMLMGKEAGCDDVMVKASGDSANMFSSLGFMSHGVYKDSAGIFADSSNRPNYALMSKSLATVV